ncbi:MAG: MBL fold metallo-hydrolase, partial [Armatimonadota bacterium]|nr:MBL fold metallo-hydrolase [Armatimonadota bacterium]
GGPARLNGLDFADDPAGVEVRGVRFRALKVYESPARDEPISMPYFSLGGVSLCHSGDLGHALTAAEIEPIKNIDVFLAVTGGPPTVALADLKAAINLIQPRLVIPMHYQTGKVNLNLSPLDDFLAQMAGTPIVHHNSPTLGLSPGALPSQTTIVVLPSAR